jgi:hypothetical protein
MGKMGSVPFPEEKSELLRVVPYKAISNTHAPRGKMGSLDDSGQNRCEAIQAVCKFALVLVE